MSESTDYWLISRDSYSSLALFRRALAQLVPIIEPFFNFALKAPFTGPIKTPPHDPVREIVLPGKALLGRVVVDIAFPIAEVAHQPCRRVQDVPGRHQ